MQWKETILRFCSGGSSTAGPPSLSEWARCFTTYVCTVAGWLALNETRPEEWKGRKGRISLWEHMEMTKLSIPLGPPGRINLPCWPWTAACDKTFFLGTPLTGKEAQGKDTAGSLSFQLLRTLLLTFTSQILLGCYCVCERERDWEPVFYGGDWLAWALFLLSLVVLWILFYVYCPLTFLKRSLQSRKPYSEDRLLGSKVDRV